MDREGEIEGEREREREREREIRSNGIHVVNDSPEEVVLFLA